MAAKTVTQLPAGPGWSFEPKYDGFRALAFADPAGCCCSRASCAISPPAFPDVAAAVAQLGDVVVDGELVVWRAGRFDFAALQDRLRSGRARVRGLVAAAPAAYVVFDLLARNGKDLLDRPYWKRRRKLEKLLGGQLPDGLALRHDTLQPDTRVRPTWSSRCPPTWPSTGCGGGTRSCSCALPGRPTGSRPARRPRRWFPTSLTARGCDRVNRTPVEHR